MPLIERKTFNVPIVIAAAQLVELIAINAGVSKTAARRLLKGAAVHYQGPATEGQWEIVTSDEGIVFDGGALRIGKHKFFKLPVDTCRIRAEIWDEKPPEVP